MGKKVQHLTPKGLKRGLEAIAERYPKFADLINTEAAFKRSSAWFIKDCGWMTDALFLETIDLHRAAPKHGSFAPDTSDLNFQASQKLDVELEAVELAAPWRDKAKSAERRSKYAHIKKASPETVALCMSRIADDIQLARNKKRDIRAKKFQMPIDSNSSTERTTEAVSPLKTDSIDISDDELELEF